MQSRKRDFPNGIICSGYSPALIFDLNSGFKSDEGLAATFTFAGLSPLISEISELSRILCAWKAQMKSRIRRFKQQRDRDD